MKQPACVALSEARAAGLRGSAEMERLTQSGERDAQGREGLLSSEHRVLASSEMRQQGRRARRAHGYESNSARSHKKTFVTRPGVCCPPVDGHRLRIDVLTQHSSGAGGGGALIETNKRKH